MGITVKTLIPIISTKLSYYLKEYWRWQWHGTSLFIVIWFNILSPKILEGLAVYFGHLGKHFFHSGLPFTQKTPILIHSAVGGGEVHVLLVVPELVDHEH